MSKEWDVVELLKHARHDWLNRLQLIKGNLSLNRLDRVQQTIEEIIAISKNESKLTSTGAHKLTALLLTYGFRETVLKLDIEVNGKVCDLSPYDEELADWCESLFYVLENVANKESNHHLNVSFYLEEGPSLFFDFSGIIENEKKIEEWLSKETLTMFNIACYKIAKDELTVQLVMNEKQHSNS